MNQTKTPDAAHLHRIVTTLPEGDQREHWMMHVACNHTESGMFARKADQFHFEDGEFELRVEGPEIVFDWHYRDDNNSFRVGRYGFACRGYWQWYGNWCWDATKITDLVMAKCCCRLKRMRFTPLDGTEEMWRWWESL